MLTEKDHDLALTLSAMATAIARLYMWTQSNVTQELTADERIERMNECRKALDEMFEQNNRFLRHLSEDDGDANGER